MNLFHKVFDTKYFQAYDKNTKLFFYWFKANKHYRYWEMGCVLSKSDSIPVCWHHAALVVIWCCSGWARLRCEQTPMVVSDTNAGAHYEHYQRLVHSRTHDLPGEGAYLFWLTTPGYRWPVSFKWVGLWSSLFTEKQCSIIGHWLVWIWNGSSLLDHKYRGQSSAR